MSKGEIAKNYFLSGYNCAQSVVLAFKEEVGMDETTLLKVASSFGGGLGRLRLTCGAVSGVAVIIGLIFAESENSPENKIQTYAITRELCERFQNENGSLICADLLTGANVQVTVGGDAEKRTDAYYKKRPCADIVYSAAEILENYLKEKGIIV